MGTIRQLKAIAAGHYRVNGEKRPYSRETLKKYVENTNKAIQSGLAIPFVEKHVDVDKEGSALNTQGWVKRLFDQDGWLGYEIDVTNSDMDRAIENKSVLFTSPEFRDGFIDGKSVAHGDIVRHVAATATPRNPDQGAIEHVPAGVARFSMDDFEPDEKKDDEEGDGKPDAAGIGEGGGADGNEKAVNPDMPKDEKAEQKAEALVALFSQIGIELPADWSFDSEGAVDILMAGLKTKAKVESESKAKEEEKEDPPGVQDSQQTMQFSESEIAALPESMRAKARKANEDAIRFSEEREAGQRNTALAAVKAAKIPPGLRTQLTEKLTTIRFSESGEQPTLTVAEVVSLVEKSLPPSVLFDEEDVREVEHPEAGAEMTPAEAEAYARRIHTRNRT